MEYTIHPIAHIRTDFTDKFGIPRQSGLVPELTARIVFEPEYRVPDAVRGIDGYSHLWLLWMFSESVTDKWSPTVRPPRLGGNVRMGVFATRSPFRPNPIGLSSVELERVEYTADRGPVLIVRGADLMDGTPIFDIKPYIAYADAHPEAKGGFTDSVTFKKLSVVLPENAAAPEGLESVLENDPRPRYQDDPDRVYGMEYAGCEIKFKVTGDTLTVISIE
jgi:tRNA-Thr(GGU) m(6)t(6)A37 methyltransferase TsaA